MTSTGQLAASAARGDATSILTSTFPSVVRIKRKRDEPVLPGFVLSSKRPSLAALSIGGNEERESQLPLVQPHEQQTLGARPRDGQPPRCDPPPPVKKSTRFRFAGTVPACASSSSNSSTSTSTTVTFGGSLAAAQTFAREMTVRRQQGDARIRAVNIRRSSSTDTAGAVQHMLELRRCASSSALDGLAGGTAVPKLRPFGPPLPPAPRDAAHASRPSMPADEALLEDIWRDAAVASQMVTEETAAEESDEFVYDEYTIAPAGGEADASDVDGASTFESEPEIWWEELDDETVHGLGLVGGEPEIGSDSEGELDYPDEENSDEDESDDDYCR